MMKIVNGPRYEKAGTSLHKKQHRIAQIATLVFAELLPSVSKVRQKKATTSRWQAEE
jgi:hypothetical protein